MEILAVLLFLVGVVIMWYGVYLFFKGIVDKFKYKEIRSQSEWEKNGFHPMFESVARHIVSKKECTWFDLTKKFRNHSVKFSYRTLPQRGLGLAAIEQIGIALEKAKIIERILYNYHIEGKFAYSKTGYKAVIKSQKKLTEVLKNLETLKKNVGTEEEIRELYRLEENEKRKKLGMNQLDENWEEIGTTKIKDACYLYLMKDFNTGYYKIGISNSPEYREKTLQSEKPTIEMICNKKYVSRRMAASFEQALHKTFSEKRVRGEWFELNQNDVEEIKSTLNSA
jgi:regulator of replication initiation timing